MNDTFNIDVVKILVARKAPVSPECFFLDKTFWDPGNQAKEQKLLQYLCGLANVRGSRLVIGVKTRRNRAYEIDPLPTGVQEELWLTHLIRANIKPALTNLSISFLPVDEGRSVVSISFQPNDRPYMFSDGRYYSLINRQLYWLDEDEVRRLYLSKHQPLIEFVGVVNTQGVALLENGLPREINFYPKFIIRNAGTAVERNYKVEIYIPSVFHDAEFSPIQQHFNRLDGQYCVFSITSRNPIFQQEIYTIAEAKLCLTAQTLETFLNERIIIKVYYSTGMQSYDLLLAELFTYQHKVLNTTLFAAFKTD